MITLSGDPYNGACEGYRAINPEATGDDWEKWIEVITLDAHGEFDNFDALAQICNEALASQADPNAEG